MRAYEVSRVIGKRITLDQEMLIQCRLQIKYVTYVTLEHCVNSKQCVCIYFVFDI